MKKIFRKLACCSFLSIASIGCFDAEARVTKEVAEAVLPYLMEAAGIEEDQRKPEHQAAIISMIYTDEGQQQMVKWARDGVFPPILTAAGFTTANLYLDGWLRTPLQRANSQAQSVIPTLTRNLMENLPATSMLSYAIQAMRDAYIGALFPCGPGTFSSFAAHQSRLGYHALTTGSLELICSTLLTGKIRPNLGRECQAIIERLRSHKELDNQLSSIIFVLDICETVLQVKNILNNVLLKDNDRDSNIDRTIERAATYNEYAHRPVSATAAETKNPREGDCVETLFKHIIAIAIQQDERIYQVTNLPTSLQGFFKKGVSGEMNLNAHSLWKKALTNAFLQSNSTKYATKNKLSNDFAKLLDFQNPKFDHAIREMKREAEEKISKGSVENIVAVLEAIAFHSDEINTSASNDEARLTIALNKLAGNENFAVKIVNRQTIASRKDIPSGVSSIIEIIDRKWKRVIIIGVWGQEGHAEIISIKKLGFMGMKPGFLL